MITYITKKLLSVVDVSIAMTYLSTYTSVIRRGNDPIGPIPRDDIALCLPTIYIITGGPVQIVIFGRPK